MLVSLVKKKNSLYNNEWPKYDTKQSGGEVPVMLELWEMFCSGMVGPDWFLFIGQIELNWIV